MRWSLCTTVATGAPALLSAPCWAAEPKSVEAMMAEVGAEAIRHVDFDHCWPLDGSEHARVKRTGRSRDPPLSGLQSLAATCPAIAASSSSESSSTMTRHHGCAGFTPPSVASRRRFREPLIIHPLQ
jgi:hypothetical protein